MTVSLIGKRIGNYDIQAKLGEGGMGAVFLGLHPQIGKRVAVKVLHEELASKQDVVTRFFNEAKSVNDISHPNIVDIVDFGESVIEGALFKYIIMEFLDGESLASRVRRDGVSIRETLYIIAQCASALSASHGKGVVHRDLKPENIYLCTRGGDKNYVKILDFGIAKLTGENAALSQKTRAGMVIGTPAYMSPEQCEGRGLIDHRSDIYAIGVVMYELLTGRVPFPGDGFGEVLVAHLTRDPPTPTSLNPNIPPEIEALVLHCLRKDRAARFQSMDELLIALNDPMAHYHSFTQTAQLPPGAMAAGAGMGTLLLGAGQSASQMMPMGGVPSGGMAGGASTPWAMPPQGVAGSQVMPLPMSMGAMSAMGNGSQVMPLPMPMGSQVLPLVSPQEAARLSALGPPQTGQEMMVQGGQGARPTTLSGSAGEAGQGRRPVSVLLGFTGAMLIGVLAMVGIRALSKPAEVVAVNSPNTTLTPTKGPAPAAQMVTVSVDSTPPGAEVHREDSLDDGKGLVTPVKIQVKKGATLGLKLKLEGYGDETRSIVADKDQTLAVALGKLEKAPDKVVPVPDKVVPVPDKAPDAVAGDPAPDEVKPGHHRSSRDKLKGGKRKKDKKPDDGVLPPMF